MKVKVQKVIVHKSGVEFDNAGMIKMMEDLRLLA